MWSQMSNSSCCAKTQMPLSQTTIQKPSSSQQQISNTQKETVISQQKVKAKSQLYRAASSSSDTREQKQQVSQILLPKLKKMVHCVMQKYYGNKFYKKTDLRDRVVYKLNLCDTQYTRTKVSSLINSWIKTNVAIDNSNTNEKDKKESKKGILDKVKEIVPEAQTSVEEVVDNQPDLHNLNEKNKSNSDNPDELIINKLNEIICHNIDKIDLSFLHKTIEDKNKKETEKVSPNETKKVQVNQEQAVKNQAHEEKIAFNCCCKQPPLIDLTIETTIKQEIKKEPEQARNEPDSASVPENNNYDWRWYQWYQQLQEWYQNFNPYQYYYYPQNVYEPPNAYLTNPAQFHPYQQNQFAPVNSLPNFESNPNELDPIDISKNFVLSANYNVINPPLP